MGYLVGQVLVGLRDSRSVGFRVTPRRTRDSSAAICSSIRQAPCDCIMSAAAQSIAAPSPLFSRRNSGTREAPLLRDIIERVAPPRGLWVDWSIE